KPQSPKMSVFLEQPIIGVVSGASQTLLSVALQAAAHDFALCYHRRFPRMKLIDISVPLDQSLASYPDNLPFSLEPVKRIARGVRSTGSALLMSAHAGTHVDALRYVYGDGSGTEALALEMLIGRSRVIELGPRGGISAEDFAPVDLSEDVRVLIK